MGLFNREKGWVRGTAQVVWTGDYKPNVSAQNITLRAIVEAPGIDAFDSKRSFAFVRSARWPSTGDKLPVLVNPKNTEKWKVIWDEVEMGVDRADRLAAEVLEQRQSGEPDPAAVFAAQGGDLEIVDQIRSLFPDATVTVDSGDPAGKPVGEAGGGEVNVFASDSGGDPVERIEKLAKLHAAGIIDDVQFEKLKQQIIGQG